MAPLELPGKASDFLKFGVAAAARGDIERVRQILKMRPQWIHHVGSHGRTLLWEACHRGKLKMVQYLVRRKASIDACGTHYTPYFVEVSCYCIAAHKRHLDVANYLLKKGARLNIHTAAFLGDLGAMETFIRQDASQLELGHPQHVMASMNDDGLEFVAKPAAWATPLCYALRGAKVDTVAALLHHGAVVKGNEEALFIAADEETAKIKLLLQHGADPQLMPAVHSDEGELFKLAQAYKVAPADISNSDELVYLCRGDRGGNPQEVERLLHLGFQVNFQDSKGKTALHRAARAGFVPAMQLLLGHGADTEITDSAGETPLFDAVRSTIKDLARQRLAVQVLMKAGANPTHPNHKQETPQSVARESRRPGTRKLRRQLARKD